LRQDSLRRLQSMPCSAQQSVRSGWLLQGGFHTSRGLAPPEIDIGCRVSVGRGESAYQGNAGSGITANTMASGPRSRPDASLLHGGLRPVSNPHEPARSISSAGRGFGGMQDPGVPGGVSSQSTADRNVASPRSRCCSRSHTMRAEVTVERPGFLMWTAKSLHRRTVSAGSQWRPLSQGDLRAAKRQTDREGAAAAKGNGNPH